MRADYSNGKLLLRYDNELERDKLQRFYRQIALVGGELPIILGTLDVDEGKRVGIYLEAITNAGQLQ